MTDILDKVFGYVGSSLLIVSMIPQLYKTYQTKSASDISSIFLGIQLFTAGTLLTYSILIYQIPMIYGNCGILIELLLLSFMKWKWRNRVKDTPNNLVEMKERFQTEPENLNKILERSSSFIRKRTTSRNSNRKIHLGAYDKIDIEKGRENIPTVPDIDTDSGKSEEEEGVQFQMNSSYSSTDENNNVFLYETSL